MGNEVMAGFPAGVLVKTVSGEVLLVVDNGYQNESKPALIIGNVANQVLVDPKPGAHLHIKGLTILGNGNSGDVKIKRGDGTILLPAYFSAQNRAGTTSALNINLNTDEVVTVTTTGRGASDETFVGVSYLELYE